MTTTTTTTPTLGSIAPGNQLAAALTALDGRYGLLPVTHAQAVGRTVRGELARRDDMIVRLGRIVRQLAVEVDGHLADRALPALSVQHLVGSGLSFEDAQLVIDLADGDRTPGRLIHPS